MCDQSFQCTNFSGENSFNFFLFDMNISGSKYSENVAVLIYVTRNGLLYFKSANMFYCLSVIRRK